MKELHLIKQTETFKRAQFWIILEWRILLKKSSNNTWRNAI